MERVDNQNQNLSNQLREFPREILDKQGMENLALQVTLNRQQIVSLSDDFGLDKDFLLNKRFLVGPFVSPAPITTTFAGKLENFETSQNLTTQIAEALRSQGFDADQSLAVLLAMTEIPTGGAEAMDCFIVPKNVQENQRIRLLPKAIKGQVYSQAELTNAGIEVVKKSLKDTFNQFLERNPELKRKSVGQIILNTVISDLQESAENSENDNSYKRDKFPYLRFAHKLNYRISQRILPSSLFKISYVDLSYYSPFLTLGIN